MCGLSVMRGSPWKGCGAVIGSLAKLSSPALATWPLLKNAPKGDGHPVVVFPGLGAGDATTAPLRSFRP